MLLTSAVTLLIAGAMSLPADLLAGPASVPWGAGQVAPPPDEQEYDESWGMSRAGRSGAVQDAARDDDGYERLDRGKSANFVRLGRAGHLGGGSFLRLGRGPASSDSFIRLGRDRPQNYIRLGRGDLDLQDVLRRESRGGQTGTPRIRSRVADGSEGDLAVLAGGGKRDSDDDGFRRPRRTGASSGTFGRGKLADSNFIRLGRSKRSAVAVVDDEEVSDGDPRGYLDLPAYVLGPELAVLPQPSGVANTKREKNYIRFG